MKYCNMFLRGNFTLNFNLHLTPCHGQNYFFVSMNLRYISSKWFSISSRQELRRFLRQVKRQNPEKTCFLEYDKLYVDHKPYVWNEVRWKTILKCFWCYNIKNLQELMNIVYLKFRYWGKSCLLQRISDSVEWQTGVC